MVKKKKNLTEFKAMLCSVVACTLAEIADLARNLPREKDTRGASYISFSDRAIRTIAMEHRHKIYSVISSPAFKKKYPQMKRIEGFKCSEFVKIVIMMIVSGFDNNEIARFLLADKQTINSTRSKRKKEISEAFGS